MQGSTRYNQVDDESTGINPPHSQRNYFKMVRKMEIKCKNYFTSLYIHLYVYTVNVLYVHFHPFLVCKCLLVLTSKTVKGLKHPHAYSWLDSYRLMSEDCDLCMSHQSDSHKGHICCPHVRQGMTFTNWDDPQLHTSHLLQQLRTHAHTSRLIQCLFTQHICFLATFHLCTISLLPRTNLSPHREDTFLLTYQSY